MARQLHIHFPGALYHITARSNNKQNILLREDDYDDFLLILGKACKR